MQATAALCKLAALCALPYVCQVGVLVATLQLDARLLIQAFDLGFCDAFMPAETYEECEAAAKHAAAEKVSDGCARQGRASHCCVNHGKQLMSHAPVV